MAVKVRGWKLDCWGVGQTDGAVWGHVGLHTGVIHRSVLGEVKYMSENKAVCASLSVGNRYTAEQIRVWPLVSTALYPWGFRCAHNQRCHSVSLHGQS